MPQPFEEVFAECYSSELENLSTNEIISDEEILTLEDQNLSLISKNVS